MIGEYRPVGPGSGTVGARSGRDRLTVNRDYYVSTTGSDSNGGTNSSTDAWATLQHALHFIAINLDFAGFTVFIHLGIGTFAGAGSEGSTGGGNLVIKGAGSTNTFLDNGPNDGIINFGECFDVQLGSAAQISIDALTFKQSAAGNTCFACYIGGQILSLGDATTATVDLVFDFSAANPFAGINISAPTLLGTQVGTIGITGGGASVPRFFFFEGNAGFVNFATWTPSGTQTITIAFAELIGNSTYIEFSNNTFSGGTVNGPRYSLAGSSAVLYANGVTGALGPNYFPGNSIGMVDPTSSYDGFYGAYSGAGLPTTTQFPDTNTGGLYKDTSGGGVYMVYNDAGTIKKVSLT